MMRLAAALFLGMLFLLPVAVPAAAPQTALPAPPRPAFLSQVIDDAGILPAQTLKQLKDLAASNEYWTGYQFVAVISPSLGDDIIQEQAQKIVQKRGIGLKGKPGVLLLVAVREKQAWIEAGASARSALPMKLQKAIIDHIMLPNFRLGNMERGITDGCRAVTMALQGAYTAPAPVQVAAGPGPGVADWLPLGIAAAFIMGAMGSAMPLIGTTVVVAGVGRAMGRW